MCGRYNLKSSRRDIAAALGFSVSDNSFEPRYNIAPSQLILAVRRDDLGSNEIVELKWGLIPFWIKNVKSAHKPINARVETVSKLPYFRLALKSRRCLIPANGFYEWRAEGKIKQPFLFHQRDDALLFFAGLWEYWVSPEGEVIETAVILTTTAHEMVKPFHDRMPIILRPNSYQEWIDPTNANLDSLMATLPSAFNNEDFEVYPVSTIVNSPKNDVPECAKPLQ